MTDFSIATLTSHFPDTSAKHDVINPTSGKRIYELPQLTAEQVALEIDRARDEQIDWAAVPVFERCEIFLKLHDSLLANEDKLLDLLQLETGKSRAHAYEEFSGAVGITRYYGKISEKALSVKKAATGVPLLLKTFVRQEPIGVVGIITPWNYPLALAMMDVVPALIAGNCVVHKTDNQTTLISLLVRLLAVEAGLPEDAWRIVAGDGAEVGNAVTDNVDYIAFTGSTNTGRAVAQRAASRLIGFSLELGGKNPAIVLPSADAARAAEIIVAGCFGNAGQLCVSISRVYVPNAIKADFERAVVAIVEKLRVGKSNDFDYDLGSLTSAAQLARVERYVADAKQKGAQILIGGSPLPDAGPYFFAPTVITNIKDDVLLKREEVFGPVLSVYGYDQVDEAVDAANDSEFGLNSSVIGDRKEAVKIAARINSGSVNINEGYRASFASFGAPMGGTKRSGFGRRNGIVGLLRFTETKAVGIARSVAGIGLPTNAKQWRRMVPLMRVLAKTLIKLP